MFFVGNLTDYIVDLHKNVRWMVFSPKGVVQSTIQNFSEKMAVFSLFETFYPIILFSFPGHILRKLFGFVSFFFFQFFFVKIDTNYSLTVSRDFESFRDLIPGEYLSLFFCFEKNANGRLRTYLELPSCLKFCNNQHSRQPGRPKP